MKLKYSTLPGLNIPQIFQVEAFLSKRCLGRYEIESKKAISIRSGFYLFHSHVEKTCGGGIVLQMVGNRSEFDNMKNYSRPMLLIMVMIRHKMSLWFRILFKTSVFPILLFLHLFLMILVLVTRKDDQIAQLSEYRTMIAYAL